MYKYTLDPEKERDDERVRFLGRVYSIDKASSIFILDNGIRKITCILLDSSDIWKIKERDVVRVFGKIIKLEKAEIYVDFFQKFPRDFDIDVYNEVIMRVFPEDAKEIKEEF